MASGPQDNPDWVDLAQAVASVIYGPTTTPLPSNAAANLGIFYVGNVAGVYVDLATAGVIQLVQLSVSFCNDSNGANTFHTLTIQADLTQETITYIPVFGNFLVLQLVARGAGAPTLQANVSVVGIAAGARSAQFMGTERVTTGATAALAAGSVLITLSRLTVPGLWVISSLSTQVGVNLICEQQYANGVWTDVGRAVAAAAGNSIGQVALLAAPTRLRLQNTAGVAADVSCTMIPVA